MKVPMQQRRDQHYAHRQLESMQAVLDRKVVVVESKVLVVHRVAVVTMVIRINHHHVSNRNYNR